MANGFTLGIAERICQLFIKLGAVRQEHQFVFTQHRITPHLHGQENHCKGLARPLSVPDDPTLITTRLAPSQALYGLVNGTELLIARYLLHHAGINGFEHCKILEHIQEIRLGEQTFQQDFLCPRCTVKVLHRSRIGVFPFKEMFHAGCDRANPCFVPVCGHHHQVVVEQFFRAFIMFGCAAVGIAQQLVNACFHGVRAVWGFAFNHRQRQTVHKAHNVGNDVLINTRYLELIGAEKFVVFGVFEINDVDSLPFVAFAQVLHDRHALIDDVPNGLVCFDQIGIGGLGQVADNLVQVLVIDPWIDAFDVV